MPGRAGQSTYSKRSHANAIGSVVARAFALVESPRVARIVARVGRGCGEGRGVGLLALAEADEAGTADVVEVIVAIEATGFVVEGATVVVGGLDERSHAVAARATKRHEKKLERRLTGGSARRR